MPPMLKWSNSYGWSVHKRIVIHLTVEKAPFEFYVTNSKQDAIDNGYVHSYEFVGTENGGIKVCKERPLVYEVHQKYQVRKKTSQS